MLGTFKMICKVYLLSFFALALLSSRCRCLEASLHSDDRTASTRSMRQVDGDASDSEVSGQTGRSGSSRNSKFNDLRLTCDDAREEIIDIANHRDDVVASPLYALLKRSSRYDLFHHKLYPNHKGSICSNSNVTCCKPTLEKVVERVAQNEYKYYYNDVFQEHMQTCISPGKRLLKSSVDLLGELIQQLEVGVNRSLSGSLPHGTFTTLKNYMLSFVTADMPHICPLPGILNKLTNSLIQLTLDNMFDTDENYNFIMSDPESAACMLNVSTTLVQDQLRKIQSSLEKQLEEMSLLSQSLGLSREILNAMRRYTFSPSCLTAIMRMRYCPICSGYGKFRPCLYLCINTLQGCFADLAEIRSSYMELISSMEELSDGLVDDLSPEVITQSYFNQFVLMIHALGEKQEILSEALQGECRKVSSEPQSEITRTRRSGTLFQNIQGPKEQPRQDPLLEQLDPTQLSSVMKVELGCLEKMADIMVGISEEICLADQYEYDIIAHNGNELCWTGTTLGKYEHPRATGLLKKDQLKNPAYSDIAMSQNIRYARLISVVEDMTQKINTVVSFNKLCEQSDDEDCFRENSYKYCSTVKPPTEETPSDDLVSGSGSGTGMNDTDDTEHPTTPSRTFDMSTIKTEPRDTTLYDNVVRDEMNRATPPATPSVNPFTVGTMTIKNKQPSTQDGFDNSIPGLKKPRSPAIEVPISIQPVTLVSSDSTQTEGISTTTDDPQNGDSTTTSVHTSASTDTPPTPEKISIQAQEDIPYVSGSAPPPGNNRLIVSVLTVCLCILILLS